jgi:alpha-D-ribose 1-methylphosphonate 5-triphosphate diphosphatase
VSALILANARVVTRTDVLHGSVRIEEGRIAAVEVGATVAPAAIDCNGDYIIPGLVELHTDVLERYAFPRPGVRWPEIAAVVAYDAEIAAAGITTCFDSLALGYVFDTGRRPANPRPLAEAVRAAQATDLLRTQHFLHLRCEICTAHVIEDFVTFAEDPLVRLVSIMDHTPGQRQFVSLDKYRQYYQGKYGLSDAQIEALIAQRRDEQARFASRHRAAVVSTCHEQRWTLVSHDDATVTHIEEAAKAGTTIAEFPTTREAAEAAHAYGLAVLVGAPNLVLGGSHSGNIAAGELAGQGLLDILSSDYIPASLLHGAFLLHRRHGASLPEALACVTVTPARRAGLDDRGEVAPGLRADLVQVHLADELPVVRRVWRAGRWVA